jgi:hypothetical protein
MSDVRYFGFSLATIDREERRGPLGRFLALAEPMPVGTELEVDGERVRVTRVEETEGGSWARAGGEAVPTAVPIDATVREVPADATTAHAEPASSEAAGETPPEPEPSKPNDDGSRGGRKRRNKKTVMGR